MLMSLVGTSEPLFVVNSMAGMILIEGMIWTPLAFLMLSSVFRSFDGGFEEAAVMSGAGPFTTFRRITMPQIWPGILAGSGLAFARALGEFGAVVLIAGNLPFRTEVASVSIFGFIQSDEPQSAAAVSLVLLVFSLVALAIFDFMERRSARGLG